MSSNHARIVYRNGEWIFEDLNSKNGSYKLGPQGLSRIMEQPVSDGDQYQLGSSIFRFRRPT
jgi:pSer/pThr/pTyr-binding forkhead associated (FHA) protein